MNASTAVATAAFCITGQSLLQLKWLRNNKRNTQKNDKQQQQRVCILCSPRIAYQQQPKYNQDAVFRLSTRLNTREGRLASNRKQRLILASDLEHPTDKFVAAERWFGASSLTDRLARSIAAARAIDMKEFVESYEFFSRTRRVLRASSSAEVADLCCGHGLVGIFFAVLEKDLRRVWLIDKKKTKSLAIVWRAACSVAPWVREKVVFVQGSIEKMVAGGAGELDISKTTSKRTQKQQNKVRRKQQRKQKRTARALVHQQQDSSQEPSQDHNGGLSGPPTSFPGPLPHGTSIFSVHACGDVTDMCISLAHATRGHVAVMPCCYTDRPADMPAEVHEVLGRGLACDINRTYRLARLGYHVTWGAIPCAVTSKNRIILGKWIEEGPAKIDAQAR